MADPLGPPGAGMSPFLTSKATVDTALSLLRDVRRRQGAPGNLGAPGAGTDPLGPSVRVLVRNDTQAALSVFDVVKLGDPVQTISDDASAVLFSAMPAFKGTAPSATTDQFGILEEPISYPGGGRYAFGRAVVQGVVPCKIQVSDSGHGYATPSGSYTDRLASASTGPARILWKESGTGEKWAVVLLAGLKFPSSSATITVEELDGSPSVTSVDTLIFDQTDGFVVAAGGAGEARVDMAAASSTANGMMTGGTSTVQNIGGPKVIKALCVGSSIYGTDAGDGNISASQTVNSGLHMSATYDLYAGRDVVSNNTSGGVFKHGANAGVSGSFTTTDGKTVTVSGGIITSIV